MSKEKTAPEGPQSEDGRRQRSERNRQKIIAAMFDLVRSGDYDPSVARIAERAGVGLRTVFRHFEDVDSLYREMSAHIDARILPEIQKPLAATHWHDRVKELMKRRIRIFEDIMPVRITARTRRFRSEFLMQDHKRFVAQEKAGIALALPQEVLSDTPLAMAFDVAMSFDTWRRLREDHSYSKPQATAVVESLLDALIAKAETIASPVRRS